VQKIIGSTARAYNLAKLLGLIDLAVHLILFPVCLSVSYRPEARGLSLFASRLVSVCPGSGYGVLSSHEPLFRLAKRLLGFASLFLDGVVVGGTGGNGI
jgi:hypothetical protein